MEVLTGFGANVASNVLSGLWKSKGVQFVKTAICLRQAVAAMEGEAQHLVNVVRDIKSELAQEQRPAKRVVQAWLDRADNAIQSSESIRNRCQQPQNCLICCPNCLCRFIISKHIVDWKRTVNHLHSERQSDFPQRGDYGDDTPAAQIPIGIPQPFVGNAIHSAQLKLEQWLTEDANIQIIGVHGMAGVGKTRLLQTINNSLQVGQGNSFDHIIWVTVSKDYDILNLQDGIANRLNLQNFPHRSSFLEDRIHSLKSYLGEKKFLMILDDMWKSLELHTLGVSLNNKGSKIVLTTRIKDVCTAMEAQEIIKVEPLSEEEGWQLFCSRAFPNGNVPQEIAADVARECKGLPLAINVIAGAMRNLTYQHEWEHALRQIQSIDETFYGMQDEVEEKLFQRLRWSYDALQNDLKTCFLSFAAYPEDYEIYCEKVIECWIAEGAVKGSGDSYLPDTAHSI